MTLNLMAVLGQPGPLTHSQMVLLKFIKYLLDTGPFGAWGEMKWDGTLETWEANIPGLTGSDSNLGAELPEDLGPAKAQSPD